MRHAPSCRRAFSLIELVIVVVIIGIIGAIALPRMSSAAERAAANAVVYDQATMQRAIDMYREEHGGVLPHVGAGSKAVFAQRLLGKSDANGNVSDSGIYGPYLRTFPTNSVNGLQTLRINGAAPGANTHGWHYNSVTGTIVADHTGSGYTVDSAPTGGGGFTDSLGDNLGRALGAFDD